MLALVKGRPGRIAAQVAVLAAVAGAGMIYSSIDKSVTLSIDGRPTTVHVFARSVADLLDDQGVKVGSRDIVAPARSSLLTEGETVVVRYARPLNLTINGTQQIYWTTETSVDQALSALGVRTDGASMSASRSQRIDRAGLVMWLSTPKQVTLIAGGHQQILTTVAPTVSALLTQQNLTVSPLDKLSQVPGTALRDGLVVKLVKIRQQQVRKSERISFRVREKASSKLTRGTVKVITRGHPGKRSALYELTLADGKVSQRTLLAATVTTRPVAQVVEVGTKSPKVSSSSSRGSSSGSRGSSGSGLNWGALAKCESGGRVNAYNRAGYYGLYQFSLATWHAQGGSGTPTDYGAAEQTKRAKILYGKSGSSSWPSCGHHLFD